MTPDLIPDIFSRIHQADKSLIAAKAAWASAWLWSRALSSCTAGKRSRFISEGIGKGSEFTVGCRRCNNGQSPNTDSSAKQSTINGAELPACLVVDDNVRWPPRIVFVAVQVVLGHEATAAHQRSRRLAPRNRLSPQSFSADIGLARNGRLRSRPTHPPEPAPGSVNVWWPSPATGTRHDKQRSKKRVDQQHGQNRRSADLNECWPESIPQKTQTRPCGNLAIEKFPLTGNVSKTERNGETRFLHSRDSELLEWSFQCATDALRAIA